MNEAAVAFRCGEDSLSRVSVSAERLIDGRHRMLGYDAGLRIEGEGRIELENSPFYVMGTKTVNMSAAQTSLREIYSPICMFTLNSRPA
jgi:hypothetical protein